MPVFDADAITVVPYLGSNGLKPFADLCLDGKGIFVVVRSSNPSAGEVQDLQTDGGTVAEKVAASVRLLDSGLPSEHGFGPIGVVLGAQAGGLGLRLRHSLPGSVVLVPGYGAQGGTAADAARYANGRGLGILVNSSQGLLYGHGVNTGGYVASVTERVKAMAREFAVAR